LRFGLINNLRAGRNKRRVRDVVSEIEGARDVVHAVTTSAEMVPEALAQMEREQVELLVVNGGDGTLERVLTGLLANGRPGWLPVIAPLRGGRTNVAASDFGAARDSAAGLRELLADARAGRLATRVLERGVLRVTPKHGGAVRCGMFVGAGLLGRAVTWTSRKLPKGRAQETFGVGLVLGKLLFDVVASRDSALTRAEKIRVSFDGQPLPDEERLITLFTTLERLIFGIRPYWGTGDGAMRATLVRGGAPRIATTVPRILVGCAPAFATPEHGYTSANLSRAELRCDCEVTVDGELFPVEPDAAYTIEAEPRVRFARA
jgi:diacylglycerol kinase family enzyme